LAHLHLNN